MASLTVDRTAYLEWRSYNTPYLSGPILCSLQPIALAAPIPYVRLQGLDPARQYEVIETGQIYGGDELMYAGVPVQIPAQDFASVMWRLKAV